MSKKKALFLSLFATGLSGIVAEYCFATLSTYFIGDSVKQWAIVISLMVFSMGLGSRFTKRLEKHIFRWFIFIEFTLSICVSFSAVSTYFLATQTNWIELYIYSMSMLTGILIGMEIPLAVRLNDEFESLKLNVANVLEKDYYGSLIGGLFFVFIGLPYLGLTYTPFLLGGINLMVAMLLLYSFKKELISKERRQLILGSLGILVLLIVGALGAEKIVLYGEQNKFKDKIVIQQQSMYQKIVVTQWKEDYWLYLNDNLQFSSFDEPLYHEVLIHPVMTALSKPRNILILGGGDGLAARELLKYEDIQQITLVDLDPALTNLFRKDKRMTEINNNALNHPKVNIINQDGFSFMNESKAIFDLIIIDLPDPRNVELGRLYSKEFYETCLLHLTPKGGIITQAGSPYYTPTAYKCIELTMGEAGFSTLGLHNQILSMGEWGWVLGSKEKRSKEDLIQSIRRFDQKQVQTEWFNRESVNLITSFGKDYYGESKEKIEINQINNPVLYRYYQKGNWDTY